MAKVSKKTPITPAAVEIDNLSQFIFGDVDEMNLLQPEPLTQIPNVDVFSNSCELVIEVELPGVRKDDIDVTIFKNTLTIRALKFECFEEDKVNYVCMERAFGRMYRAIDLPFPVDTMKIKAVYRDGVLTIVVPRVEDKRCSSKRVNIENP